MQVGGLKLSLTYSAAFTRDSARRPSLIRQFKLDQRLDVEFAPVGIPRHLIEIFSLIRATGSRSINLPVGLDLVLPHFSSVPIRQLVELCLTCLRIRDEQGGSNPAGARCKHFGSLHSLNPPLFMWREDRPRTRHRGGMSLDHPIKRFAVNAYDLGRA
jgi:hypothetical protein